MHPPDNQPLTLTQLQQIESIDAWTDNTLGHLHYLHLDDEGKATLCEGNSCDGPSITTELANLQISNGCLKFTFLDTEQPVATGNDNWTTWELVPLIVTKL